MTRESVAYTDDLSDAQDAHPLELYDPEPSPKKQFSVCGRERYEFPPKSSSGIRNLYVHCVKSSSSVAFLRSIRLLAVKIGRNGALWAL